MIPSIFDIFSEFTVNSVIKLTSRNMITPRPYTLYNKSLLKDTLGFFLLVIIISIR